MARGAVILNILLWTWAAGVALVCVGWGLTAWRDRATDIPATWFPALVAAIFWPVLLVVMVLVLIVMTLVAAGILVLEAWRDRRPRP